MDSSKQKITAFIIVIVFIGVGLSLWSDHLKDNQIDLYKKSVEAAFKQREQQYTMDLNKNELTRRVLEQHNLLLEDKVRSLEKADSVHSAQLLTVKGMYNKLTSSELTEKMIQEYNNRPK